MIMCRHKDVGTMEFNFFNFFSFFLFFFDVSGHVIQSIFFLFPFLNHLSFFKLIIPNCANRNSANTGEILECPGIKFTVDDLANKTLAIYLHF